MINQKKKEVRIQIKEKKKEYTLEQKKSKSGFIFEQIEKLDDFQEAKVIMAYWSMDDEVFTHDFILKYQGQKQIILPEVSGDNLKLKEFSGLHGMKTGSSFGILEPEGDSFEQTDKIDLIIVPGVAFDKSMNRLGRGKAYYDKLLKNTSALKIGVCFDFQFLESVPVDEHDIKMDLVITN